MLIFCTKEMAKIFLVIKALQRQSSWMKTCSGTTTLIISNKEMNDIIKIVKALKDINILFKGVTKEQKGGFLILLLRTLGVSFLRNMLTGKKL